MVLINGSKLRNEKKEKLALFSGKNWNKGQQISLRGVVTSGTF